MNEEHDTKLQRKRNLLQKVTQRKFYMFGHVCRNSNNEKIKLLVPVLQMEITK